MKKVSLLLFFVSSMFMVNCQSTDQKTDKVAVNEQSDQKIEKITASQYMEMKSDKSIVLIDLRSPGEIANGFIEGATFMDFNGGIFDQKVSSLNKDDKYVIYCASGRRSGRALETMKSMGFKNVSDLIGGFSGWAGAGLPVVKK